MVPDVEVMLPELTEIFKRHKIMRAYLFGKATQNLMYDDEEIDFLIEVNSMLDTGETGLSLFEVYHEICEVFGHCLNVLTFKREDFPLFSHSFNASKLIIYE